jgi:hypothetical protein
MDTGRSKSFSSLRQANNRLFNHCVHLSRGCGGGQPVRAVGEGALQDGFFAPARVPRGGALAWGGAGLSVPAPGDFSLGPQPETSCSRCGWRCSSLKFTSSNLELARIGSLLFIFADSPSYQIGSPSPIDTFATRLSARPLSRTRRSPDSTSSPPSVGIRS